MKNFDINLLVKVVLGKSLANWRKKSQRLCVTLMNEYILRSMLTIYFAPIAPCIKIKGWRIDTGILLNLMLL